MRHYSRVEWTKPNRTTTNNRQRQWMILPPFDQALLRVFALMTRQIVPPPPPYANRLVGNQLERLQQRNDRPTKTATLFLYRTQFEKRSCTGDSLSCRILLETFGSILSIFNFPKNFVFLLHLLVIEYSNRFSKYSSKHESSLELDIFYVDKQKRNEQGVKLTATIGNCKFNCIVFVVIEKKTNYIVFRVGVSLTVVFCQLLRFLFS